MDEMQRELYEVVTQVKTYLEYQRALGISSVAIQAPQSTAAPAPVTKPQPRSRASEAPLAGAGSSPEQRNFPHAAKQSLPSVQHGTEPPKAEAPVNAPAGGLAAVREELGICTRCKLHKGRKTVVFGEGNPEAVLVFIGEGPGHEEDLQGKPFVGAAGQLLTDIIVKGMKLRREDVYICNIVKCRPPENRNPEPDEIAACEPFLIKQLRAIKPKVIVALGSVAAKTLLKTSEGITALRGKWKTYEGIPLMPTFHPAYLLRNPADKKFVWEDIKKVIAEMEKGR